MTSNLHTVRRSGIVLHPTSLPGRYGSGDLGDEALRFVDWLVEAGQSVWQVLPLSPVGGGFSPYTSASAFAGNPLLISPDRLVAAGLATQQEADNLAQSLQPASAQRIEPERVSEQRMAFLRQAFQVFQHDAGAGLRTEFERFRASHAAWLEDFALFMALHDAHGGRAWNQWDAALRGRDAQALEQARQTHAEAGMFWMFTQWLFDSQWQTIRRYANDRGVQMLGDVPIYCAFDSVDVWANPQLFQIDQGGNPTVVAGVPPDYFSADGQKWGNPLYDWPAHEASGFDWWCRRIASAARQTDVVRIDHFRGLAAYWEVPVDAETARHGRWRPGPGRALFDALRQHPVEVALVAEDLGIITEDVVELRTSCGIPGMAVLQFAFGDDAANPYLPHNLTRDTVVYTGTHDNDTTAGWWATLGEAERHRVRRYLQSDGSDICWDMIRLAASSVAQYAIYPLQDILGLDSSARMNTPGHGDGQWLWRHEPQQFRGWETGRLREISEASARLQ